MERVVRRIKVGVPAGVDDGTQIRLSGEGEPGANGGPRGNLYVVVEVKASSLLPPGGQRYRDRSAGQLRSGALGTEVEVPTVDGPATLKIPAGTQPGRVLRMRGRACLT